MVECHIQSPQQSVGRNADHRFENERCLIKICVVDQIHRMCQRRAVVQSCVIKQIVVRQIIPFTTRKSQVACRAVFKAFQAVIHEDFSVGDILPAWKLKPPSSRTVVSCFRIVLVFPRVGLNPCRVSWVCGGNERC